MPNKNGVADDVSWGMYAAMEMLQGRVPDQSDRIPPWVNRTLAWQQGYGALDDLCDTWMREDKDAAKS